MASRCNQHMLSNPGVVGNIAFDNPAISAALEYIFMDVSIISMRINTCCGILRNDSSSAFGANNQWGYFQRYPPDGVSVVGNFTCVAFQLPLDELKLRRVMAYPVTLWDLMPLPLFSVMVP